MPREDLFIFDCCLNISLIQIFFEDFYGSVAFMCVFLKKKQTNKIQTKTQIILSPP